MSKVSCKGLTYEDCELAILRSAVDKSDKLKGKEKLDQLAYQGIYVSIPTKK